MAILGGLIYGLNNKVQTMTRLTTLADKRAAIIYDGYKLIEEQDKVRNSITNATRKPQVDSLFFKLMVNNIKLRVINDSLTILNYQINEINN